MSSRCGCGWRTSTGTAKGGKASTPWSSLGPSCRWAGGAGCFKLSALGWTDGGAPGLVELRCADHQQPQRHRLIASLDEIPYGKVNVTLVDNPIPFPACSPARIPR